MNISLAQSVHNNETYQLFEASFFEWPVLIAVVPIFYILPTLVIISRIFYIYCQTVFTSKKSAINEHIFLVLSLAQFMSFLYFFADYLMLRLPATGFFTAWCANSEPNHYLKLIFFFTFYFNYSAMVFPFLLCLLRLLLMLFPNTHMRISGNLLKIVIPLTIIYPICFTFFLIPAVGYCRQLGGPYPFGSVSIYYAGSLYGMHNSPIHLTNTCFWMAACLFINVILFIKLRKAKSMQNTGQPKSTRSYKAELSLTVTTVSMIMPYLTYCIFTIFYLTVPSLTYYMMIIRPFGNDCETVIVPWVFFLTHPVFKARKASTISVSIAPMSSVKSRASNTL